jgi:hypothetical protein
MLEAARDDELPVLVEGDRHRVAQVRFCTANAACCDACCSFVMRTLSRMFSALFLLTVSLLPCFPLPYHKVVQNLVVRLFLLLLTLSCVHNRG